MSDSVQTGESISKKPFLGFLVSKASFLNATKATKYIAVPSHAYTKLNSTYFHSFSLTNNPLLSKKNNELKRRLKQEAKQKEKEEKEATKKQQNQNAPKQEEDENIDPNEYHRLRIAQINHLKATEGESTVYPHKFHVSISLTEFVEKYSSLANEQVSDDVVKIAGRVYSKRAMGQKLRFYDLRGESQKVQIMSNANFYKNQDDFVKINERVKLGDIVGVVGQPCRTKAGELSIRPSEIIILTPCLHQMPHMHYGLKDKETRFRQRYLDLMMNDWVKQKFVTKTRIIKYLRAFLDNLGFLEDILNNF
ncbi:lysine--tRNA ligase isoform X1 [Brachionus plicatilis]|uniref:Lysine--tRNA ligase n=1 Tax=Brachionus plicatilis TaxID=10195 RepID=A0A3M7QT28_BRAPC|nr:lysine--tRNA ligase isoform X1 [Brachionus plicatilis]